MKPRPHRYGTGTTQLIAIVIALAIALVLALAAITRHALGEPILPARLVEALHQSEPSLPRGMTYVFDVIDPHTRTPLLSLPPGGAVEVRLAVTNDSALPIGFDFPTPMQCEFVVRRIHPYLGGLFILPLEVWRSSYFRNTVHGPSHLSLVPGQTKVYQAFWQLEDIDGSRLGPGDYRVLALFHGVTYRLQISKPD